MITRVLYVLGALYLALVLIGVALVSGLKDNLGFLPALAIALAVYGVAGFAILRLLARRVTRLGRNLGLGAAFEPPRGRSR